MTWIHLLRLQSRMQGKQLFQLILSALIYCGQLCYLSSAVIVDLMLCYVRYLYSQCHSSSFLANL